MHRSAPCSDLWAVWRWVRRRERYYYVRVECHPPPLLLGPLFCSRLANPLEGCVGILNCSNAALPGRGRAASLLTGLGGGTGLGSAYTECQHDLRQSESEVVAPPPISLSCPLLPLSCPCIAIAMAPVPASAVHGGPPPHKLTSPPSTSSSPCRAGT